MCVCGGEWGAKPPLTTTFSEFDVVLSVKRLSLKPKFPPIGSPPTYQAKKHHHPAKYRVVITFGEFDAVLSASFVVCFCGVLLVMLCYVVVCSVVLCVGCVAFLVCVFAMFGLRSCL